MPEDQLAGTITQTQYNQFTAAWATLVGGPDAGALQRAFEITDVAQINFLNFSIDQISALVNTPDVNIIKARFLYMPDTTGQQRFSTTLFAVDADNRPLSAYYIPAEPTPPATAPTQPAAPATTSGTQIPRKTALEWFTAWDDDGTVAATMFDTGSATLKGYNFEVATFSTPLAAAQPTEGKALFLNFGLHQAPSTPAIPQTFDLVVYIDTLGSRTQGTLDGVPNDEVFYNRGTACPPSAMS